MNLCLNSPVFPVTRLILLGWMFCLSPALRAQPVLTLSDAVNKGLQQNLQIQMAVNEAEMAEKNVFRGNAGYLPVVTARASFDQAVVDADVEVFTGSKLSQTSAGSTTTSAGIRAEWTLFEGMGRAAAWGKLKEQLHISNLETEMTIEEVVAGITRAYCNIIREKHLLEACREKVQVSNYRYRLLPSNEMPDSLLNWSGFRRRF
jgi:outer membrane protein TolC